MNGVIDRFLKFRITHGNDWITTHPEEQPPDKDTTHSQEGRDVHPGYLEMIIIERGVNHPEMIYKVHKDDQAC